MFKKNDEITLEITDMDTKGSGIGKGTDAGKVGSTACDKAGDLKDFSTSTGFAKDKAGAFSDENPAENGENKTAQSAGKKGADTSCGFTFFVKGALVGDTVRARVTKVKKNYGYARVEKILRPSPCRTTPRCPVAGKCGGCQLQHCRYTEQLRLKQERVRDALTRIGGFAVALPEKEGEEKGTLPAKTVVMEPILSMEDPTHYRNKTQLPVAREAAKETSPEVGKAAKKASRTLTATPAAGSIGTVTFGKTGRAVAGFYAGRTHVVIPQTDCAIAHPCTEPLVKAVLSFINRFAVSPYEEKTGTGLVRHIVIRVGPSTGQVMVCLVLNGKALPQEKEFVQTLRQTDLPGQFSVSGICVNVNTERTNVILGKTVRVLYGRNYIEDCIGNLRFRIGLNSFYQVNSVQTKKLYETALEFAGLTGVETVWDIYCGIGTISLFLAQRAKQVVGVEAEEQAVQNAKTNARINGISNVEFLCGEAEKVLPGRFKKSGGRLRADVVTLDPPRKGCERALLDTVIGMEPQKIVYVSCDPATLARDLSVLCQNGYALKRVKPCDMFPQTVHVETVTLLLKNVP